MSSHHYLSPLKAISFLQALNIGYEAAVISVNTLILLPIIYMFLYIHTYPMDKLLSFILVIPSGTNGISRKGHIVMCDLEDWS